MPISKFNSDTIDSSVDLLLTEFYTLPKDEAIAALETLINLPMMSQDEKDYPPLPSLFTKNLIYKTPGMQYALKNLSEMMYNRQPQKQVASSNDHGPAVYSGKFGLHAAAGEDLRASDVHHYLKYKFAITALSILALPTAIKIANTWKSNSKLRLSYYREFSNWVISHSGEGMPQGMQDLIASQGILRAGIKNILQTALAQDGALRFTVAHLFEHILDLEEKASSITSELKLSHRQISIISDQIIQTLFSLEPAVFDPEMESCLYALHYSKLIENEKELTLTVLKQDPYKSIQHKLQKQFAFANSDKNAPYLPEVALTFIKVAQAQEYLNLYGNLIKVDNKALATEAAGICQQYVQYLDTAPASTQMPLQAHELTQLDAFLVQANQCLSQYLKEKEFADWISNFFALYFEASSEAEEVSSAQLSLLKKMLHFAYSEKTLALDDNWLVTCYQKNFDRQEQVVNVSPYEINRILLHALITPVEDWSEIYASTLHAVLTQVLALFEIANANNLLIQRLGQDSYPPEFIAQIAWLSQRYVDTHSEPGPEAAVTLQPLTKFPLLYYPKDRRDLKNSLRVLPPDKISALLDKLCLPLLIDSSYAFSELLLDLEPAQVSLVYERLKIDILPLLINHGYDFVEVVRYLGPVQKNAVYASVSWSEIIKNRNDCAAVLDCLEPEQIIAVCTSLKDRLPTFIDNMDNCKVFTRKIENPESRIAFFECIKAHLPSIVQSMADFSSVISYLEPLQIIALCESLKDRLSTLINDIEDLAGVFLYLEPRKVPILCEILKDRFTLINNAGDFAKLLYLNQPETISLICKHLNEHLLTLIKTGRDFRELVFGFLSSCRRIAVYETVKMHLPTVIKNADDLAVILAFLNTEECTALYESIKKDLPTIIKNFDDLFQVLEAVNVEQQTMVWESVKAFLPSLIKNEFDFNTVIRHLNAEQISYVCAGLGDRLTTMFPYDDDFDWLASSYLSGDQRQALRGAFLHLLLADYMEKIYEEEKIATTSNAFHKPAYSISEKIDAAFALNRSIIANENNLDPKHHAALKDGKLRQIIENYLKIHRPNISINEFLDNKSSAADLVIKL